MNAVERARAQLLARPGCWLVTGAAGFIGSHLVEALLSLGQHVTGLDNFSLGSPRNLDQVRDALGAARWRNFRFLNADVRDPEACRHACRGVDLVLHQAALGSVPRSMADPLASHASNVTGHLNMLLAARDAGVKRFVYASSSAVYGDEPGLPRTEARLGRALSPYALTKRIDELYAEVFARCYGFETIGLRYFNVFGPRQNPEGAYAAVIPRWIRAMILGDPVVIYGDGSTARDFCYVDNVVQANLLAATAQDPAALDQVYNVAVNASTTLNDLFALMRDLLAPRIARLGRLRPDHRAPRAGDVPFSLADIGKAERLLGYQPQWRLRDGMARTIDWYAARLDPPRAAPAAVLVPSVPT